MAQYGVPAETDGRFRSLERLPWQREWRGQEWSQESSRGLSGSQNEAGELSGDCVLSPR